MNNEKVAIPELDSMKELPDLCANRDIRAEVKDLYYRYRGRCESFLLPLLGRGCDDAPKYYVYAWYAKTEPKKYFYVGKGTAMRYKHSLDDLDQIEQFFINLVKSAIVEEYRVLRNTAE